VSGELLLNIIQMEVQGTSRPSGK